MNKSRNNIFKIKKIKNLKIFAFYLFFCLAFTSCSKNPNTGKNDLTLFMSKEQEKEIGARQHTRLISGFGGVYEHNSLGVYVASIGADILNSANLDNDSFTFTILNTPIVNAFAAPGGYIYVTRGLLAFCNSEAELAAVISHEIAHIAARHSSQRYSANVLGNIGASILGVAMNSGEIHSLGSLINELGISKFSRSQELEADRLALIYLSKSGYDVDGLSNFLKTLDNLNEFNSKMGFSDSIETSIFSTHPPTKDRIRLSKNNKKPEKNIKNFIDRLDGIIFGDDPSQGIVRNNEFSHPSLKISIKFPIDFVIKNTSSNLVAFKKNKNFIKIDISSGKDFHSDPLVYLKSIWRKNIKFNMSEKINLNRYEAATGYYFSKGSINSYKGKIQIRYLVVRMDNQKYLRFIFISKGNEYTEQDDLYRKIAYSIKELSDIQTQSIVPLRLNFYTVEKSTNSNIFAKNYMQGRNKIKMFDLLNGFNESRKLFKGDKVKILRYQ